MGSNVLVIIVQKLTLRRILTIKDAVTTVLVTGMMVCGLVAIVAIIKGEPVMAGTTGSGSIILAAGAEAVKRIH